MWRCLALDAVSGILRLHRLVVVCRGLYRNHLGCDTCDLGGLVVTHCTHLAIAAIEDNLLFGIAAISGALEIVSEEEGL